MMRPAPAMVLMGVAITSGCSPAENQSCDAPISSIEVTDPEQVALDHHFDGAYQALADMVRWTDDRASCSNEVRFKELVPSSFLPEGQAGGNYTGTTGLIQVSTANGHPVTTTRHEVCHAIFAAEEPPTGLSDLAATAEFDSMFDFYPASMWETETFARVCALGLPDDVWEQRDFECKAGAELAALVQGHAFTGTAFAEMERYPVPESRPFYDPGPDTQIFQVGGGRDIVFIDYTRLLDDHAFEQWIALIDAETGAVLLETPTWADGEVLVELSFFIPGDRLILFGTVDALHRFDTERGLTAIDTSGWARVPSNGVVMDGIWVFGTDTGVAAIELSTGHEAKLPATLGDPPEGTWWDVRPGRHGPTLVGADQSAFREWPGGQWRRVGHAQGGVSWVMGGEHYLGEGVWWNPEAATLSAPDEPCAARDWRFDGFVRGEPRSFLVKDTALHVVNWE